VLFKGDDWRGTEKGEKRERNFAAVGVDVVYFPYTQATSSSALRRTLQNADATANRPGDGSEQGSECEARAARAPLVKLN
jgi:glycerol-3-phosphate cytidylyltransferase